MVLFNLFNWDYKKKYYGCIAILLILGCTSAYFEINELLYKVNCDYECQLKDMCKKYCEHQGRGTDFYFNEECNDSDLVGHFMCLCLENKTLPADTFNIKYILRSDEKCS